MAKDRVEYSKYHYYNGTSYYFPQNVNDVQWVKGAVDYLQKHPEITRLNFDENSSSKERNKAEIPEAVLQALLEKKIQNITELLIPLSNFLQLQKLANSKAFPNLTFLNPLKKLDISPEVTSCMENSELFQNLKIFEVDLINDPINAVSNILKACPNLSRLHISSLPIEQAKNLADYCVKEKKIAIVATLNPLFRKLINIYQTNRTEILEEKDVEQLVLSLEQCDLSVLEYLIKNPDEFPGIENAVQKIIKDCETQIEPLELKTNKLQTQTTSLKQKTEELDLDIKALELQITGLKAQKQGLDQQIQPLEKKTEELKNQIKLLNKDKQKLSQVLKAGGSKEKTVQQQAQAIGKELKLSSPPSAQSPTSKASGNQPTQKSPHR